MPERLEPSQMPVPRGKDGHEEGGSGDHPDPKRRRVIHHRVCPYTKILLCGNRNSSHGQESDNNESLSAIINDNGL